MRCKDIPIFVLRIQDTECFHQHKCRVYLRMTMNQNIKTKNICILSQTGSWEILVRVAQTMRVAIAMRTTH